MPLGEIFSVPKAEIAAGYEHPCLNRNRFSLPAVSSGSYIRIPFSPALPGVSVACRDDRLIFL